MTGEAIEPEVVQTHTPLSEVLSSEADAVITQEPEPAQEAATETGEQVKEPETAPPAEETKPEVKSEEQGFMKAMLDERGKRQDLERQIKTMQDQQNQAEKPDAFVNPDQAIDFSSNQVMEKVNGLFWGMSEAQARGRHDDFDAMQDTFFNEMVTANPLLGQQAMQSPDPYEFVYQQAKTHKEFEGISSMGDYKAKIETEMRAKLEAEYADKAKAATNNAINSALPPSLSTATATGGNHVPEWGGPTSLSNILGK